MHDDEPAAFRFTRANELMDEVSQRLFGTDYLAFEGLFMYCLDHGLEPADALGLDEAQRRFLEHCRTYAKLAHFVRVGLDDLKPAPRKRGRRRADDSSSS